MSTLPRQFGGRFEALAEAARRVQATCLAAAGDYLHADASVRQVGRRLGLRNNLAWKLVRVAHAEHAADIIAVIPGGRGQASILAALAGRDTPPGSVEALQTAFEDYHATMRSLDIDSRELAIMASGGLNDAETSQHLQRASQQITEGYAQLRGHRIEFMLVGAIGFPSRSHPGTLDIVGYELCHGVTRLRPGGPIRLRNAAWSRDGHQVLRDAEDGGVVSAASTPDLDDDELIVVQADGQSAVYVDPHADRTEPLTVAFLQVYRHLGPMTDPACVMKRRRLGYHANCSPVRLVAVEYLQLRDMPRPVDPSATADFAFTEAATLESTIPYDRIPYAVEPYELCSLTLPEALASARPYYDALIRIAAARAGHPVADLVGHRVTHENLPMACSITFTWGVPRRS